MSPVDAGYPRGWPGHPRNGPQGPAVRGRPWGAAMTENKRFNNSETHFKVAEEKQ
jgi:hypothetical protein